jgi:hypothetical protein
LSSIPVVNDLKTPKSPRCQDGAIDFAPRLPIGPKLTTTRLVAGLNDGLKLLPRQGSLASLLAEGCGRHLLHDRSASVTRCE